MIRIMGVQPSFFLPQLFKPQAENKADTLQNAETLPQGKKHEARSQRWSCRYNQVLSTRIISQRDLMQSHQTCEAHGLLVMPEQCLRHCAEKNGDKFFCKALLRGRLPTMEGVLTHLTHLDGFSKVFKKSRVQGPDFLAPWHSMATWADVEVHLGQFWVSVKHVAEAVYQH